jgi:hypothetical protein
VVGSADGLFRIEGEYDSKPERWSTEEDGLPSSRVQWLAAVNSSVVIGTPEGASVWNAGPERPLQPLGELAHEPTLTAGCRSGSCPVS